MRPSTVYIGNRMTVPLSQESGLLPPGLLLKILTVVAFTYPLAHFVQVERTLSAHDLVITVGMLGCLIVPALRGQLNRLVRSGYGLWASTLITAVLGSSVLGKNSGSVGFFSAQIVFVYMIAVPVVVCTMVNLPRFSASVGLVCTAYTVTYLFGLGLLMVSGVDVVVSNSGNERYNPAWLAAYHMLVLHGAYLFGRYAINSIPVRAFAIQLGIVSVLVLASGSRTSVVGLAIAFALTIVIKIRQGESGRVGVTLLVGAGAVAVVLGVSSQLLLGNPSFRFSTRIQDSLYSDSSRLNLLQSGFDAIGDSGTMLVGRGLGTFTDSWGNRIHNCFVQYLVETGLVGAIGFGMLFLSPLYLTRRIRDPYVTLGRIIYLSQAPFFMFSGVATQRSYYLAFAIGMSFLMRPILLRNDVRNASSTPRSSPSGAGRDALIYDRRTDRKQA